MQTILQQKNNILAAFNAVNDDNLAQDLFGNRLNLWLNANTPYTNIDEFMGIFIGFSGQIKSAVKAYNLLVDTNDGYTRKNVITRQRGTTATTTRTGTDTTTNGEQTQNDKQYIYPQGFTGETDKAYIAAENDMITPQTVDKVDYDTTDKTVNSGEDTDTEEIFDIAEFVEHGGATATNLMHFIDQCIYEIMPITLGGDDNGTANG